MRRAAVAACFCLWCSAWAAAQAPASAAKPSPAFLPRYDFALSGVALSGDDPRYSWDAHFGGDLDLVDYGVGRAAVLADYEAVLGSEFQPFDPNQGNYRLETSSSVRAGRVEVAGVFHHVSRHLGDRPKRGAVAWNVFGARVQGGAHSETTRFDLQGFAGRVIQHSFVDYAWAADLQLQARRRVNGRVEVFGRGRGEAFGVDRAVAGRDNQTGGLVEGGLRLNGEAGAIELFAGYEKRVDAYPIERVAQRWLFAGFRLVGK
jgi:hypothetical protein